MPRARAAPLASVALGRRRHPEAATATRHRHGRRAGAATSRATASPTTRIDELVDASHRKIIDAPALVLGCLTWDGLDRYPDEARQRAEWGMALLSLGAAVENLMLAAADAGLRVVLGRGADLLPRGGARRARAPRRVAPPRDGARRPPRSRLRRPRAPAGPARRAPRLPLDALRARSTCTGRAASHARADCRGTSRG